jgi:phage nucleotide-binding protein
MSIKFEDPNMYPPDFPVCMGLYGYNGVGKTTFAGRTGLRTIHLDCGDAGKVALKGSKNVKTVKIQSTKQYIEIIQEINLRYASKVDLLVPDTITGLQTLAIREVKGKGGEMNRRRWGQVASKLIECLYETSNFPHDIIYLVQEKNRKKGEGDDSILEINPSLVVSVREFFSSRVDWIGRLYLEGQERRLDFRMTEEIEAKDRANLFPKVIINPNFLSIRKRIRERLSENSNL